MLEDFTYKTVGTFSDERYEVKQHDNTTTQVFDHDLEDDEP